MIAHEKCSSAGLRYFYVKLCRLIANKGQDLKMTTIKIVRIKNAGIKARKNERELLALVQVY